MVEIKKQRIEWIDLAKFFGFVLVLVGHKLTGDDEIARALIFSFHMPLFIILSAITCSWSTSLDMFKNKTKKRARHLLIPYAITIFILFIIEFLKDPSLLISKDYWISLFPRFFCLVGPGIKRSPSAAYFFVLLFVTQTLFDFVQLVFKDIKKIIVTCFILTLLGVGLGLSKIYLPFALDMSLSMIIFVPVGLFIKSHKIKINCFLIFLASLVIWIFLLYVTYHEFSTRTYFELWARRYPWFPISHFCALFGSVCLIYFSKFCVKIPYVCKPLIYLGRNTLVLLIVHAIDISYFRQWFKIASSVYLNDLITSLIGLGISLIIIFALEFYKKRRQVVKIGLQN